MDTPYLSMKCVCVCVYVYKFMHGNVLFIKYTSGADKSLARPGRKQATATEDFDVHISYLLS